MSLCEGMCPTELGSQAIPRRWAKLLLRGELDALREGVQPGAAHTPKYLAAEGGLLEGP